MKYLFLATFLSVISFITYAQDSNEVQIKGDPEVAGLVSKNVGKELPVGLGCEALPEKKGCSARLMCYAQSKIYNNNPASKSESIQEAREMAQLAYVEFIEGVKVDKDKNCVKKVGRLMENNQSKERIARLCNEITNYSTSGKALGLEALATKVDVKQMEVTVVVGRRCEGMDVRDAIKKQDRKSNSSGGDDDFDSVEAIEGIKSNTYQLDDF
ncbi:hypothetical protein N9S07_00885 [Nitrosomonadales bacterium]|jgi:hypothetical protein|nr:hypothetical protein [Nitrosomonadales bacterium]